MIMITPETPCTKHLLQGQDETPTGTLQCGNSSHRGYQQSGQPVGYPQEHGTVSFTLRRLRQDPDPVAPTGHHKIFSSFVFVFFFLFPLLPFE